MHVLLTRWVMKTDVPVWLVVVLFILLVVVFNAVPAAIGAPYMGSLRGALGSTPSAPPPLAFAIMWPVLYTLLALAAGFLVCYPSSSAGAGVQWTAFGLLMAQLVLNWFWTPVYATGKSSTANLLIVAMLMLTLPAIALSATAQPLSAALMSPYAAWLVFALVLSAQGQASSARPVA